MLPDVRSNIFSEKEILLRATVQLTGGSGRSCRILRFVQDSISMGREGLGDRGLVLGGEVLPSGRQEEWRLAGSGSSWMWRLPGDKQGV